MRRYEPKPWDIRRCDMIHADEGEYVLYCDAQTEIERLRRMLDLRGTGPAERYWEGRWRDEAADNERMRAALQPFAEADEYYDSSSDDNYAPRWAEFFTIGDFRRARAALAQKGGE